MTSEPLKLLLVEDNPGDARLIQIYLSEADPEAFDLTVATSLAQGIETALNERTQLAILDLSLPDSLGLDTVTEFRTRVPDLPLIVITGTDDQEQALAGLKLGALDYLVKGEIGPGLLRRSIRYALERRRMEEEKSRLEAQLRQVQKMEAIGTLAGGIAHDFNNILTAIIGYGELALDDALAGLDTSSELSEILKASRRAKELVTQILTFSRKVEPDLMPVGLNKIVTQTSKMLERTIPRMIAVEHHLAQDLDVILADPNQISQVLLNLTTNAWDAMPEGGRLTIETANQTLSQADGEAQAEISPGDYVVLTVSDTGVGVDQETLGHIFEPFFTQKAVGQGTGLGLALVYGIVKNHGGHVSCQSRMGQGTTFRVCLPVHHTETGSLPVLEAKPVEEIRGGGETILLVDDEESIRNIGRQILTRRGYRILTANNGEEALSVYREKGTEIGLVILDISMPGMGGHKCLLRLLGLDPQARVVISSGYSRNGRLEDTIAAGAAGFVPKPFTTSEMLRTVREVLDS